MATTIRRVQYFYTTIKDRPGEGYRVLSMLAGEQVNLLAFTAVPVGPEHTQLTLFPEDQRLFADVMRKAGVTLSGPTLALLVQGDDRLGVLADIHRKLYDAEVNVYASTGITDGRGSYGCLLYLRPEQFERAAEALEV
ncbi:MAG: hypothetical protein AB1486_03205 [Planctomycetota bacterium]